MADELNNKNTEDESVKTFGSELGEGLGCLLICIGIAIIIWAFQGFPGLA